MASAVRKPVLVAGILLECTQIEVALNTLSMSRGEVEKLLAASPDWPFPASLDGWKLGHDAIRYDMESIQSAINTTKAQIYDGKALVKWQVDALQLVVREFYRNAHKHQKREEEIFFPWMATRVKLPLKLNADHRTLMALMDNVRDLCDSMRPMEADAAKATLDALAVTFSRLRSLMRQHLEEEEIIGLPLLRKHFTAKEAEVPEKKIVSDMKPCDLAWFLRPMDPTDKREAMCRLKIPAMVQQLAMLPAVRKDEATVVQAYRELASGQQLQRIQEGGFGRFKGSRSRCGLLTCFAA